MVQESAKILIIVCGFLLFSCAQPTNYLGQKAVKDEWLELPGTTGELANGGGGDPLLWQGKDLTVSYTLKQSQENLMISGHIKVSDSVLYSFPLAKFFYFYVYLLDQNGVAIAKYDISPGIAIHSTFPDSVPFAKSVPTGSEARYFAFGYWGVFADRAPRALERGDDWEIFYHPFQR